MVTHQLQVERRTGKVRRPETDVLPLCHATNQNSKCLAISCPAVSCPAILWSVSFSARGLEPAYVDKPLKSATRRQCDASPTVTFPDAGHHRPSTGTKLYCLPVPGDRGTCVCASNLPKVVSGKRNGRDSNPRPFMCFIIAIYMYIV